MEYFGSICLLTINGSRIPPPFPGAEAPFFPSSMASYILGRLTKDEFQ